jgi:hypothetical protein
VKHKSQPKVAEIELVKERIKQLERHDTAAESFWVLASCVEPQECIVPRRQLLRAAMVAVVVAVVWSATTVCQTTSTCAHNRRAYEGVKMHTCMYPPHAHTYTHTRAHTHTRARARTHAHTHTHARAHTHLPSG